MGRVAAILGLLALGCTESEPLTWPPSELSAVIRLVRSGESWAGWAAETETPPAFAAADPDLYQLRYDRSLATLGLAPGRLTVVPRADPRARPLPRSTEILHGKVAGAWRPAEESDRTALAAVGLLTLREVDCTGEGQCWVREDGFGWCRLDCPTLAPPALPQPPRPVEPPDLGPCPPSWTELRTPFLDATMRRCRPPDLECPPGSRRWLGDAACAPIDCSEGLADLYVDAAANPGGDGSSARPFDHLQLALDAAAGDATIQLRAGDYPEAPRLLRAVRLRGTCAAEVRLVPPPGSGLRVEGATVALSRLSLRAEAGVGLSVQEGRVDLEDVDIFSPGAGGVAVGLGAKLRAQRLEVEAQVPLNLVSGTVEIDQASLKGEFIGVELSGAARLRRVHLAASAPTTLGLRSSAPLRLEESLVEGGLSGLYLRGSTATVSRTMVRGPGVGVYVAGGTALLRQVEVTQTTAVGGDGAGILASNLDLEGISVGRPELVLQDVAIEDTSGAGVKLLSGQLEAERVWINRPTSLGVHLNGADARIRDLSVWSSHPPPNGVGSASGLSIVGGSVDVEGLWLEGQLGFALIATPTPRGDAYALKATEVTIADVALQVNPGNLRGQGVLLAGPGSAELRRARIARASQGAVRCESQVNMVLEDLTVLDSAMGLELIQCPSWTADRLLVDRPTQYGIYQLHNEAEEPAGVASQLTIRDVEAGAPGVRQAIGLWLNPGFEYKGHLTVDDFLLEGLAEGALIEPGWDVVLRRGRFQSNGTGLRYLGQALEPGSVQEEVQYRGNDLSVDLD